MTSASVTSAIGLGNRKLSEAAGWISASVVWRGGRPGSRQDASVTIQLSSSEGNRASSQDLIRPVNAALPRFVASRKLTPPC